MRKRVLHLGYAHGEDDGRIVCKESVTLQKSGLYDVKYITSDKNTKVKGRFDKEEVKIEIIPLEGKRFIRLFKYNKELKKYLRSSIEEFDIYHIHEFLIWGVVPLLYKKNKKIVLDMHENDIYDISKKVTNKFGRVIGFVIHKILEHYEKYIIKKVDVVISVTPQILKRVDKYNKNNHLICNFPEVKENFQKEQNSSRNKNYALCFAGGISPIWSHKEIIKTLEEFDNLSYNLAGMGNDSYISELKLSKGWEKVNYLGYVKSDRVRQIYKESSIGMALLKKETLSADMRESGTLGNTKLFEFMLSGLPVICTNFEIWEDIIEKNNCGICINSDNEEELINAIKFLTGNPEIAEKMGTQGQKLIYEKYNWKLESEKLLEVYGFIK